MTCLIDSCEEMMRLGVALELDRIKPAPPCHLCTPTEKCFWCMTFAERQAKNAAKKELAP